jgi:hypothetical protein
MLSRLLKLPLPSLDNTFIFKDAPWLGGKHDGYPLLSFDDYERARPKISPLSIREHVAQLQCLLTFGLLEAVMEVKILESTLLQQGAENNCNIGGDRNKVFMTSKNFPALLKDWQNRVLQLGNGEPCQQWAKRIHTTLQHAHGVLMTDAHCRIFYNAGLQSHELLDILFQIGSIAEALVSSRKIFPQNFVHPGFASWSFILRTMPYLQYKTDMVANGWCPFTIQILSQSVSMLGYARTCKHPHIRELSQAHRKCTTQSCVRNMIDTTNYVPKHVIGTCNCNRYKPSLKNVISSLSVGKIPVIQCPPPHEELLSSDSIKMPYVAISHVWADGLGSTTEEGLPACQIRRLATLTKQLTQDGAFWIDALCIPAVKDMRKRAIGLMAKTYNEAKVVLVIDSGIRAISVSAPREEKLLYLLSSGWMQRLWTLQEGILAQKLVFEFSDGLVALEELLPMGEEMFNPVLVDLAAELFRLKKHQFWPGDFYINDVACALRWRTTSRESDETLAISGLLNLDAFELANLPPDQHMQTFLLRIQNLPNDIIFLSGVKLNKEGFRWAPRTLMRNSSSLHFGECKALCTSTGLMAEYYAIYFREMVIDGKHEWCIHDLSKQRFYKVTDRWLGPDAMEAGYAASYSCSVILLTELPEALQVRPCAVVLGQGLVPREGPEDEGDRILCEFKKRLFLADIDETKFNSYRALTRVIAKSGRMKVKIV